MEGRGLLDLLKRVQSLNAHCEHIPCQHAKGSNIENLLEPLVSWQMYLTEPKDAFARIAHPDTLDGNNGTPCTLL
eukprot:6482969-Amphidinium_carterae.1